MADGPLITTRIQNSPEATKVAGETTKPAPSGHSEPKLRPAYRNQIGLQLHSIKPYTFMQKRPIV